MRKYVVLSVIALAVSACGADQPPAPAGEGRAPSLQSTTPEPASAPAAGDHIDLALEALQQRAASTIRYDRIRTLDNGTNERQVFVEMLGASAEDVDAHATEVFEQAGFTIRRGMVDENGIRLAYRKPGLEPINALIRSAESGPALNDPAATSSFYIRQAVD